MPNDITFTSPTPIANTVREISIPGVTTPYTIDALYLDGHTYADIQQLITAGFKAHVCTKVTETPDAAQFWNGTEYVNGQLSVNSAETNVIYMVPQQTTGTNNVYAEYVAAITEGGSRTYQWELIGTTMTDLSNYVQKGTYTSSSVNTSHTHSITPTKTYLKVNTVGSATSSGSATHTHTFSFSKTTVSLSLEEATASHTHNITIGLNGNVSNIMYGATVSNGQLSWNTTTLSLGTSANTISVNTSSTSTNHTHKLILTGNDAQASTVTTATIMVDASASLSGDGAHSHTIGVVAHTHALSTVSSSQTGAIQVVTNVTQTGSAGGDHTHTITLE